MFESRLEDGDLAQGIFCQREATMRYIAWCVVFITGIAAYFPVIYIRKTNRLIKILEQIAANTRK